MARSSLCFALAGLLAAPAFAPLFAQDVPAPQRIRVGGQVQQSVLTEAIRPVYPALAKEAGIEGTVRLEVFITEDGVVKEVRRLMGHPLLAEAAVEAVRQWRYRPTLLDGRPVEVVTTVEVVFTLSAASEAAEATPDAPPEKRPAPYSAEALAEAREAVRDNPNDAEAHFRLGLALRNRNETDAAIEEIREAIRLDPANTQARLLLGDLLIGNKRRIEEGLAEYREAIQLDPENEQAHAMLARALERRGDFDGALRGLREIIRLKPEDDAAYISLGRTLYMHLRPDRAAAEFRGAVQTLPGHARLHRRLARELQQSGWMAGAVEQFREALALEPGDDEARGQLESLLKEKDANSAAIEDLRARIRGNLEERMLRFRLAWMLARVQGDVAGALAAYRELVSLDPANLDAWSSLASFLIQWEGIERTLAEFRDWVRREPENAGAHLGLALALNTWGDYDAALAAVRESIRLQPDSAAAHQVLGSVLQAKGDEAGARAAQARARELLMGSAAAPRPPPSAVEANEASAVGSLRTLNTALLVYSLTYKTFPASLAPLGPGWPPSRDAADLIDHTLVTGTKNGYNFLYVAGSPDEQGAIRAYTIQASPVAPGVTGQRHFFTDQSGIIRWNPSAPATVHDPPIS